MKTRANCYKNIKVIEKDNKKKNKLASLDSPKNTRNNIECITGAHTSSNRRTLACSYREEETHEKNIRCRQNNRQHVSDKTSAVARRIDAHGRNVYEHHVHEQYNRQRYGHVATKEIIATSVMSISRARSWPLLDTTDKRNCAVSVNNSLKKKNRPVETTNGIDKSNIASLQPESNPQVQAKRLLYRHYYPEGGWGWIVTFVGTLVHILGPGLQFSIPATIALPAKVKFCHHPWHTAGESIEIPNRYVIHNTWREIIKFYKI